MKSVLILCIIVVSLIFMSCEKQKCFNSAGEEAHKLVFSDSFNFVNVYGVFDIELIQDSSYFVEVFGGKNILDNIGVEEINGSLNLYDYNSCLWSREYERPIFNIHFKDIDQVNVYQSSKVYSKDTIFDSFLLTVQCMLGEADLILNTRDFFFYNHHNTGGVYRFRGKSHYANFGIYYTSTIDASDLECYKVEVKSFSIADCKVWATDILYTNVYNRGNVYYKGNPEFIIDTITSTGKLISIKQ